MSQPIHEFRISKHACRRYGERVLDLDPGEVERLTEPAVRRLVPENVRLAIVMGCTRIVANGITYVAAGGVVVTVLGAGMKMSRHRRCLS